MFGELSFKKPPKWEGGNMDKIAGEYGKWIESYPFDIGAATSNSLSSLAHIKNPIAKLAI